jgi:hypothetical protein
MHDWFAVCVGDEEALRLEVLEYMATHPQVTFSFVVHTVLKLLSHTVLPCVAVMRPISMMLRRARRLQNNCMWLGCRQAGRQAGR